MNKQIIWSIVVIFMTLSLVGGGTYAFFSNSGTSTNNVFASGTLDLQLANESSSYTDNVLATFGGSALSPGVCLTEATLNLKNTGSVGGNHIDITATNTNAAFAAFLKIQKLTFDGADINIADTNSNGFKDLQDLSVSGILNKSLTNFVAHPMTMQICLDSSAGNAQQGQNNTLDLTVLLDQGPHN